jgi:hypothetical protein
VTLSPAAKRSVFMAGRFARFVGPAMTAVEHASRAERLAPWVGGLFLALPVLIVTYPPMADLPLHEASVGLLRHWGDPQFAPRSIYFLNLGHANQLFSLLVLAFAYVVPIAWATKIVVAASVLGLFMAAAHFADHLGAPRWTALLVGPIGLGWLFFWGLIQNIVGLAVLLAVLPAIDRFATRPTWRGVAAMCGVMVLLHFAHQAMQVVACVALVLCSIGFPPRGKALVMRALPVLFSGALVYAATLFARHFAGPRHLAMHGFEWTGLAYKLITIPGVLFAGYEAYVRHLIMALAVLPLVFFVVERVRRRERGPRSFAQRVHAHRFDLLALLLFVLYLTAPSTIRSTTLVYHRFLPPAWAVIAVAAAANTRKIGTFPRALCAALPVASLLVAWPTFVDSNRMYSDLDSLMPSMKPGTAVMALNLNQPSNRLWGPMVMMGHVVAVHGGRSLFDYTQSPVSPVSQFPSKEWAEPIARMEVHPYDFRPDWDFTRFRYLLLSSPKATIGAAVTLALRDDAVLIGQKGDIYLYESRLPLVPIDADDEPLPTPHPATLRKMLKNVARELEEVERAGPPAGLPPQ